MGTVAEWLAGTATTGTPEIVFARFHFDTVGRIGGTYWIIHSVFPLYQRLPLQRIDTPQVFQIIRRLYSQS
jgi:hypothetical protein